MIKNIKFKILLLTLAILSQSCSIATDEFSTYQSKNVSLNYSVNLAQQRQLLASYVDVMANALIVNSHRDIKGKRVAVGTIGMTGTFTDSLPKNHPLFGLGNKLQEELISALTQKSINIVEFRMTSNIVITDNQDVMLSRDITHLQATQQVHYYLTGTYAHQAQGAAINLRLIDINSHDVIATANHFVPVNVFGLYQNRSTNSINGQIYRHEPTTLN